VTAAVAGAGVAGSAVQSAVSAAEGGKAKVAPNYRHFKRAASASAEVASFLLAARRG